MSFQKKSIKDLSKSQLSDQKVLVRVDFNVPLSEGQISDDTRIKAALPTINYLLENNASVILCSHMGRPKGERVEKLSLKPVAERLTEKLKMNVSLLDDCVGESVFSKVSQMKRGEVVLLENLRFHKEETANHPYFSKQLANLADIFVQDAFGVVHRAHASTSGVCEFLPSYAGFLIQKELEFLGGAIAEPKRPLIAIIGGSKISSKIGVLRHLLGLVDTLIIGGAMTYTLLKAQGSETGSSMVEDEFKDEAMAFLKEAETSTTTVLLPLDHVCATEFSVDSQIDVFDTEAFPNDRMGLDVGPKTIDAINEALEGAGTVIWNGPLGVFELAPFSKGTFAVAETLSKSSAITIIGGGDSAAAISKVGLSDTMSHISTGGGASLEFLEGKVLPGIDVLEDNKVPVND
ncbi:phosphoglycerate kinase [Candidatus Marinamargulisbacteria bacterium SCGC AAA071-K20]|nr:phosphoglycerate kinase [Candidatus Marinamargulisbacteria bacterium SCGC AAA071-K20]